MRDMSKGVQREFNEGEQFIEKIFYFAGYIIRFDGTHIFTKTNGRSVKTGRLMNNSIFFPEPHVVYNNGCRVTAHAEGKSDLALGHRGKLHIKGIIFHFRSQGYRDS